MPTNKHRDNNEAEELRKLGFEFDPPVDEYSYQPDSSSTIGGMRGKQEYGISDDEMDADGDVRSGRVRRNGFLLDREDTEAPDVEEVGISEFTGHASAGEDDELFDSKKPSYMFHVDAIELEDLIRDRLERHDIIDARSIEVSVSERGAVLVSGSVTSEALKLRIEELVSALPGVSSIDNALTVQSHH